MSAQHDHLRRRTAQHAPKNLKSKVDDKQVYIAMNLVEDYLRTRFSMATKFPHYDLVFEPSIQIRDMIEIIKIRNLRKEFDDRFIDREIKPDGGVMWLCEYDDSPEQNEVSRKPLVIAEIKRQGTNDEREREGKNKQATGNAIERLGKNLTGIKAMMQHEDIVPFVCFGWGCDFAPESLTVLSKVSMLNEFYPLNRMYIFKRDGDSNLNSFSPVSMYFREEIWTVNEMYEVMKEIAESSFRYYMF